MFLVLLLNMLGATGFTVGKIILSYLAPICFVGIRMSIAGLLLLTYYRFIQKKRLHNLRSDWWLFTQIVLFHIYGAYVLEFWAMRSVSSVKTSFLYNLNPFVTAILAYFLLHEYISAKKIVGLVIGFIGCIPMLLVPDSGTFTADTPILAITDLAIIGSVVCFAQGWIALKQLMQKGYSPLLINGIGMSVGGFLALITSYWIDQRPIVIINEDVGFQGSITIIIACLVWLILVSSIFFYSFYSFLLKKYSATFLAFAGFLSPLCVAFYGWLFLGESVGVPFFLSTIITFCGLYIFYQEEL